MLRTGPTKPSKPERTNGTSPTGEPAEFTGITCNRREDIGGKVDLPEGRKTFPSTILHWKRLTATGFSGSVFKKTLTVQLQKQEIIQDSVLHGKRGKKYAFDYTYLKCILCQPCQPVIHHSSCSGANTDFTNLICFTQLRGSIRFHYTHHS